MQYRFGEGLLWRKKLPNKKFSQKRVKTSREHRIWMLYSFRLEIVFLPILKAGRPYWRYTLFFAKTKRIIQFWKKYERSDALSACAMKRPQ